MLWDWDGTLERIHHALYVAVREQEGREASPTAAIIDSQSAKAAQKGAKLLIRRATTRARRSGSQAAHPGRHAGPLAERRRSFRRYSGSRRRCTGARQTDAGAVSLHRAHLRRWRLSGAARWRRRRRTGTWKIEIVKRSDIAKGFIVLPKRWMVERTFAWISRCRRLCCDFERYARTVAAFIRLAMIRIMLRRLTSQTPLMNPNFLDRLLEVKRT